MSSPRRDQTTAEDRLSCLPDDILLRILSFLEFSDLIKTSLLSPRWRYLWTSVPSLSFDSSDFSSEVWVPTAITKALSLSTASQLRSLNIIFGDPAHLHSWILHAVRKKVRDLKLISEESSATVHSSLYGCSSLESLELHSVELNLPSSVNLPSLRTLHLSFCTLSESDFRVILAGCPNLEELGLSSCNEESAIKIDAPSNSMLKRMWIEDDGARSGYDEENEKSGIEVSAPSLLSLRIKRYFRDYYSIKNVGSLVSANLNFEGELGYPLGCAEKLDQLVKLLEDVSHVKTLKLCSWCCQVLSLKEISHDKPLFFTTSYLELKTGSHKWDLLGMAYLLKGFPDLQELVLHIDEKPVFFTGHRDSSSIDTDDFEFNERLNGNLFCDSLSYYDDYFDEYDLFGGSLPYHDDYEFDEWGDYDLFGGSLPQEGESDGSEYRNPFGSSLSRLDHYEFNESEYWNSLGSSLSCQLQQLMTVKIYGFMGSKQLKTNWTKLEIMEFIDECRNDILLVEAFVKNCKGLEKLVVRTSYKFEFLPEPALNQVQLYLSRSLSSMARAAPNVEIVSSPGVLISPEFASQVSGSSCDPFPSLPLGSTTMAQASNRHKDTVKWFDNRCKGTVKWFDRTKGFGFISPDKGGGDLFVHRSSINSNGFCTLDEGEAVEYSVACGHDGRTRAVNVTHMDGTSIQGDRGRGVSGYGRGGYGRGNRGGRGGRGYGRFRYGFNGGGGRGARGNGRGGGGGYGGGRGGSSRACYSCGEVGHIARDCYI